MTTEALVMAALLQELLRIIACEDDRAHYGVAANAIWLANFDAVAATHVLKQPIDSMKLMDRAALAAQERVFSLLENRGQKACVKVRAFFSKVSLLHNMISDELTKRLFNHRREHPTDR